MCKRLLFIVLFVLAIVSYVFSGTTGKIAGKVTDAASGEPLFGANVIIQGTTMGAATDADGDYFIVNVPPGAYTLVASMIGYKTVNKTDLLVSVDRTVTADFSMTSQAIAGGEVVVVAERDVIAMDRSASAVSLEARDIREVPRATSMQQVVNLQLGVDFDPTTRGYSSQAEITIRGGGRGQAELLVDGLTMVDNRANRPIMMVNLSSIQEINVIKGGFNAEYGNVRSGLINIVTKEGSTDRYNGALDLRLTPGHLKHYGESIFDPNNYFLRPFLDPAVAFVGTHDDSLNDGDGVSLWDAETRARYRYFQGWNEVSAARLSDSDPTNDVTPEQAQQLFIWQHRAQGSEALGREAGSYGDQPDWNLDASFGGPVPLVGDKLGGLSFFATHRSNNELFALPTNRDYYRENNSQVKLTSRLTPSMKLMVEGIYSKTNTVQSAPRADGLDAYMTSGMDIIYSPIATGYDYVLGQNASLYYPPALNRFDITRSMVGLAFDHVLSPSTFYSLRISMIGVENDCFGPDSLDTRSNRFRDQTPIRSFGSVAVDETPFGYQVGIEAMIDGMSTTGEGSVRDYSKVNTLNAKFDITSQINKYHQIKAGFIFNYDDLEMHYEHNQIGDTGNNWVVEWQRDPYRAGAYIQDKLEFKGMIANIGLRADLSFPNSKSFAVDRFSQYFRKKFADTFQELAPSKPAKDRVELSPRLGISHPISDVAKLYFNYGHFYSMPTTDEMFLIMKRSRGLSDVGNPDLDMARTVAYELGVEYSLSDMFLLHASGYYRDITDQLANRHFVGYDGGVDYWSRTNDNYQDIRGLELRVEKRFGKWITGWANYNYLVTTSGYIGRETYYEDPRRQEQEGLQNPNQERPLARPIARANLTFWSPQDFGPTVAGVKPFANLRLDMLYQWRAGKYESRTAYQGWNPLGNVDDLDDLQWKGRTTVDLRLRKSVRYQSYDLNLYLDIANVFNMKYLEESGFASAPDRTDYMRSLRLPRYNGDAGGTKKDYADKGLIAGNDKPGDVKSADKPWIDMPNRGFLTYFNPRTVAFGVALNF